MTKSAMTAVKMLQSLPEEIQERVANKLREFVEEEHDEAKWASLLDNDNKLKNLVHKAQKEIKAGKAIDMDYEKL